MLRLRFSPVFCLDRRPSLKTFDEPAKAASCNALTTGSEIQDHQQRLSSAVPARHRGTRASRTCGSRTRNARGEAETYRVNPSSGSSVACSPPRGDVSRQELFKSIWQIFRKIACFAISARIFQYPQNQHKNSISEAIFRQVSILNHT